MKLDRRIFFAVAILALALINTGCSGINTSHSVSPATFLIPGFVEAKPAQTPSPTPADPAAPPAGLLARSN